MFGSDLLRQERQADGVGAPAGTDPAIVEKLAVFIALAGQIGFLTTSLAFTPALTVLASPSGGSCRARQPVTSTPFGGFKGSEDNYRGLVARGVLAQAPA